MALLRDGRPVAPAGRSEDPRHVSADAVGRIFREESGRSLAALIGAFGDIDLAEDALQEAFAIALDRWRRDGLPPNPGGWITTTARNRAVDRLRRDRRGRELLEQAGRLLPPAVDPGAIHDGPQPSPVEREGLLARPQRLPVGGEGRLVEREGLRGANADAGTRGGADRRTGGGAAVDDRLRLLFLCCHPALSLEAQIALTLRLLGGLSTAQVASAFLVAEATMAQRLVRAKRKIAAAHIPFRLPPPGDLGERVDAVLGVIYLVYNAGADQAEPPGAPSLRREAIRLARLLAALVPDEPEAVGLLALLLLTDARQDSRYEDDGSLVLLRDQDRRRWSRRRIAEGQQLLRHCQRRNRPGAYQLEAAINAVHADAATFEDTDWPQIVDLYDHLLELAPSPVVALNRAIAVAEVDGAVAGLALVDAIRGLERYHAFHVARGELLARIGERSQARLALLEAASLAPTEPTRRHLQRRAEELAGE